MSSSHAGTTRLIGVLVALPEPARSSLDTWRRELGDPTASLIGAHVTLVAPIEVPADDIDAIEAHLATVALSTAPFNVRLAGTDTFRPTTPTVFVDVAEGRAEFTALARAINAGPLTHVPEFDYRPHVTIAHFVPDAVLDRAQQVLGDFTANFVVADFGLYVPDDDGRWQLRSTYDLGA